MYADLTDVDDEIPKNPTQIDIPILHFLYHLLKELVPKNRQKAPKDIDFLFDILEVYPANHPIKVSQTDRLEDLLKDYAYFLHYFTYFGLWTFEIDKF
ncbi:hypothetical protein [Halobacillus amylolyticus]|uniref:Uncharacterized protein n=1 Tax=Halobacillus amylolyticus TaxID=2932259 RepID=A0ABY4HAH8_9BACI|nr:hypothetical protein [Halobacillus amylolyticus]UOR10950.1 hypothetical protein MUO15_15250 [Halobacillus amylolyticus]